MCNRIEQALTDDIMRWERRRETTENRTTIMDTGLKGKNVLITGGSSGIGLGIASVLAQEGVNLAIASRNPDESAVKPLRDHGVEVTTIKADVSREDDVVNMVASAIATFGTLDGYVNNAAWTWHQPITQITLEAIENTLKTNLIGAILACREVSRHMIKNKSGAIVIIGSTAMYTPQATETLYRISKLGLTSMTQTLAVELAPFGIRVNAIIPGHFVTRMTGHIPDERIERLKQEIPLRRVGNVEEVGTMAAFFLSDKLSSYSTGSQVTVDGGLHLRPLPLSDEELLALNE
ncbi:MAG: SDR family oxidoreductase [Candidatus Latescibacterota bacterium]